MFCRNCGNEMDNLASVCVKCGVAVNVGNNYCANCGSPVMPGAAACTTCGSFLNVHSGFLEGLEYIIFTLAINTGGLYKFLYLL